MDQTPEGMLVSFGFTLAIVVGVLLLREYIGWLHDRKQRELKRYKK